MSYLSQAVASTFLGTPLAFAVCALYVQFGPGDPATNFIMAIFLLVPVWSAILVWGLKRQSPRTAAKHPTMAGRKIRNWGGTLW